MLEGEQVSTLWLQCVGLFCLLWGLGCTMTMDGRKNFDPFFRKIIYGEDKNHPKPKTFKLAKNQLFPDRGLVFDFIWDKKNNGTWVNWVDMYDRNVAIPNNAKVIIFLVKIQYMVPNNNITFDTEYFILFRTPLIQTYIN